MEGVKRQVQESNLSNGQKTIAEAQPRPADTEALKDCEHVLRTTRECISEKTHMMRIWEEHTP